MTRFTIKTIGIILLALFATGCTSNAMFFHERTRVNFTLEARGDASSPVNSNLGYKRNLVAVTPERHDEEGKGEAVSSISTFDLRTQTQDACSEKEGTAWSNFWTSFSPKVYVSNNFATGQAATNTAKNMKAYNPFAFDACPKKKKENGDS